MHGYIETLEFAVICFCVWTFGPPGFLALPALFFTHTLFVGWREERR